MKWITIALLALLSYPAAAQTGTMGIAWDAVADWGSSEKQDYIIGYGPTADCFVCAPGEACPGSFAISLDTAQTLTGLPECQDTHVAVKARNQQDAEGPWSDPLVGWPRPKVDSVLCSKGLEGPSSTLIGPGIYRCTIHGSSIRSTLPEAGTVSIENLSPGQAMPTISTVAVVSCSEATFDLDMRGITDEIVFDIRVTNPDQTFGGKPDALSYIPTAPVVAPGAVMKLRRADK